MTKRYDEPIVVEAASLPALAEEGVPRIFSWRGKRYTVSEHLSSWKEAGEWWRGDGRRDREFHRILARPAGEPTGDVDPDGFLAAPSCGVYDVYKDLVRGGWRLARVWD